MDERADMRVRRGARRRGAVVCALSALAAAGCTARDEGAGEDGARPLEVVRVLSQVGADPGQVVFPRAIDSDGASVWVIDKTARVQRLDAATGAVVGGWRMAEFGLGRPAGVTVFGGADDPWVIVPDTHYSRVQVFRPGPVRAGARWSDEQPAPTLVFGAYGRGPGQFIYVTDVAVVPGADGASVERYYVSEYGGNDRVSAFDGAGNFLFAFGGPSRDALTEEDIAAGAVFPEEEAGGGGAGASGASASAGANTREPVGDVEFNRPQSIAWDAERGELIVVDACNHRVGRFTPEGRLLAWYGKRDGGAFVPGQGAGEFSYPYGLALVGDGTALVMELGNARVQRIDLATGASVGVYGVPGVRAGRLATPWGVAVGGERSGREVFALDSGNNRVQVFELPRARSSARKDAARAVAGAAAGGADGAGADPRAGAGAGLGAGPGVAR